MALLPVIVFLSYVNDVKASMTQVNSDVVVATTWKKENSPYVIGKKIIVSAPLIIEPGVVVKAYKGDNYGTILELRSSLSAVGTIDEKIVFTSMFDDSFAGDTNNDGGATMPKKGDWGGVFSRDNPGNIILDNIIVSYASNGFTYESIYAAFFRGFTIKNSEIKYNTVGLNFRNVLPVVESNIISNNSTGITTFNTNNDRDIKISNNSIFSNGTGLDARYQLGGFRCVKVDATYNWWGDTSGPYFLGDWQSVSNLGGKGNRVLGYCVQFNPWFRRSPDVKRDPIILVPGIGASINPDLMIGGIFNDKWTMFDRTYDGLIKAIRSAGYIEGKDFFIAYYDWRKSNAESAQNYLKPLIDKALLLNPVAKVNIIAHSMGGLVARSYVQGEQYNNDVNNLILIATPSKGSSDAYAVWAGGYVPKNWESRSAMNAYISFMKLKNLTFNSFDVVHQFIPSLKDLLPTYSYLYPLGSSQNLKDYLGMNEKNNFLINLNSGIEKLNERTKFSIILGNNQPTVNKISVVDSDVPGLWQDGKPFPINPEKTDDGGDGRVLMESGNIQSEFNDVLSFNHGEVVSEAEPIVMARLNEDPGEIYRAPIIKEEIVFWSEGPGEMEVTDPSGKMVTKDSSGVADSKFSSESKSDGFKITSIPNPVKGNYTVTINAPSSGNFYAGSEFTDNDGTKEDVSSVVSGKIEKGKPVILIVKIDPENIEKPVSELVPRDIIKPVIKIDSPLNLAEYPNNQILPIIFFVTDNVTNAEKMRIDIYLDDEYFEGDSIDLSLLALGVDHSFWVDAVDEAGNYIGKGVVFKTKIAEIPIIEDLVNVEPPLDEPNVEIPPIIESVPIIAPVIIPSVPPVVFPIASSPVSGTVLGTTTINPIFQSVTQQVSVKKSSKKKKSHKKKSKKKKGGKPKISKLVVQMKAVLGISAKKSMSQASVVSKFQNYVTTNRTTLWSRISKSAKELRDYIFKPFKYFKK